MYVPNRPECPPLSPTEFNYKDLTRCGTLDDTSINTTRVYREIRCAGDEREGRRVRGGAAAAWQWREAECACVNHE
jgi:hypothetical protein